MTCKKGMDAWLNSGEAKMPGLQKPEDRQCGKNGGDGAVPHAVHDYILKGETAFYNKQSGVLTCVIGIDLQIIAKYHCKSCRVCRIMGGTKAYTCSFIEKRRNIL